MFPGGCNCVYLYLNLEAALFCSIYIFFFYSVQSNLGNTDDAAWKEREAAVLAIGAIADVCINGLYPLLSEVLSFLGVLLEKYCK